MLTTQWGQFYMENLEEDIPGTGELTPVFSIDNGEYDWVQLLVLFSSRDKKFYWLNSRGCACCDTPSDGIKSVKTLPSGDLFAVKSTLRVFLKNHPALLTEEEQRKAFSKLKKQK